MDHSLDAQLAKLSPKPGDMLLAKFDSRLTGTQRAVIRGTLIDAIKARLDTTGIMVVVLDEGMELSLDSTLKNLSRLIAHYETQGAHFPEGDVRGQLMREMAQELRLAFSRDLIKPQPETKPAEPQSA